MLSGCMCKTEQVCLDLLVLYGGGDGNAGDMDGCTIVVDGGVDVWRVCGRCCDRRRRRC
jgi:hypothetical protein